MYFLELLLLLILCLCLFRRMGVCIWHQLSWAGGTVGCQPPSVVPRSWALVLEKSSQCSLSWSHLSSSSTLDFESGSLTGHERHRPFLSASVVLQVEMPLSPTSTWMLEIRQTFMLAWQALPQLSHLPEPWLDSLLWLNKSFCSYECATFYLFACWLTLGLFIPRVCCN